MGWRYGSGTGCRWQLISPSQGCHQNSLRRRVPLYHPLRCTASHSPNFCPISLSALPDRSPAEPRLQLERAPATMPRDDSSEKSLPPAGVAHTNSSTASYDDSQHHPELEIHARPTGIRGWYYNTTTQVVLLGFVCFMCPGLFNSLNGLGGGGQLKETTSANANSALYAAFAVFAFFAGYVCLRAALQPTVSLPT